MEETVMKDKRVHT